MLRIFIGIFVPNEIRNNIISVQKNLNKLKMKAKMIEPENLHISLSFLGSVEESKIDEISEKLDSLAGNYKKFEVKIGKIKLIPNENYVRVLAFDVLSDDNLLEKISREVKDVIGGDVKPPHLTLCRIREIFDKNSIQEIKKIPSLGKGFEVRSIQVIQSALGRTGPLYSVIHESFLRG